MDPRPSAQPQTFAPSATISMLSLLSARYAVPVLSQECLCLVFSKSKDLHNGMSRHLISLPVSSLSTRIFFFSQPLHSFTSHALLLLLLCSPLHTPFDMVSLLHLLASTLAITQVYASNALLTSWMQVVPDESLLTSLSIPCVKLRAKQPALIKTRNLTEAFILFSPLKGCIRRFNKVLGLLMCALCLMVLIFILYKVRLRARGEPLIG